MKKILALALALVMLFSFAACGGKTDDETTAATDATDATNTDVADMKIGVILIGDENEGYTFAHMEGIKDAAKKLGIADDQIIWKYTVLEDSGCTDTALDLVDQGCNLVIANSYGHGTFIVEAAKECPDVEFIAMTGDTAAISGLDNLHNAFTNIYEARYISGVVAGMKIKELADGDKLTDKNFDEDGNVKVGYVGAFPFSEVISGYTAFFLGIKSVYEDVAMDVSYTSSWFDIDLEATTANTLIADGCVIIGQHADSHGAPQACQAAQENGTVAYSIGYNKDMTDVAPDAILTSSTNVWSVYYEYLFGAFAADEEIVDDWAYGYEKEAVAITPINETIAAEGTQEAVDAAIAGILDGSVKVFDTTTFTVDGEALASHEIDLTPYGSEFKGEVVETIVDGAFCESEFRAAPYIDFVVDGITELNG